MNIHTYTTTHLPGSRHAQYIRLAHLNALRHSSQRSNREQEPGSRAPAPRGHTTSARGKNEKINRPAMLPYLLSGVSAEVSFYSYVRYRRNYNGAW